MGQLILSAQQLSFLKQDLIQTERVLLIKYFVDILYSFSSVNPFDWISVDQILTCVRIPTSCLNSLMSLHFPLPSLTCLFLSSPTLMI